MSPNTMDAIWEGTIIIYLIDERTEVGRGQVINPTLLNEQVAKQRLKS